MYEEQIKKLFNPKTIRRWYKLNAKVEQIKDWYRNERKFSNYSIIEIGDILKELAEKGVIWVLKDLKDISEYEEIIIDSYLNKYRADQVYDNLDEHFQIHPLKKESTTESSKSSSKTTSIQPQIKNVLKIRDVKKFVGYQKARELEKKIIEICKSFPHYEKKHVIDQILRSSESIKRRIAKGEQVYIGEKFNQYSIAIGSAKETSAWLQMSLG